MADVSAFEVRVEWLEAPGVSTPELAATWARYEIWVDDHCVTQVESEANFRRGVYGSLYPLAEWVVANWWFLTSSVRPSATPQRYWTWPNLQRQSWLRNHNLRGAGNGMAWPDITLVPEGAMTSVKWSADIGPVLGPVRFMSSGHSYLKADTVRTGLAQLVAITLERLTESSVDKTRLAEDWEALGHLDDDETEFCTTAARLGLDPFDVPEQLADDIIRVAGDLPVDLAADFFDSVDPSRLGQAARWTNQAVRVAERAAGRAQTDMQTFDNVVVDLKAAMSPTGRVWETGYHMARSVRRRLDLQDSARFDPSPWVALGTVTEDSAGIQGVVVKRNNRVGLVLGDRPVGSSSRLFAQATAMGRVLVRSGQRNEFLLSAARRDDGQVARAFAAELLAPAAGIRQFLDRLGRPDDLALESVARHFGVSPILVRHQYDNQVARVS